MTMRENLEFLKKDRKVNEHRRKRTRYWTS